MMIIAENTLQEETSSWCRRAEEMLRTQTVAPFACGLLVRQGTVLRRRWDCTDPDASPRREILRLLPTVQNLCHEQFINCLDSDGGTGPELIRAVFEQLDEDDHYLGQLLGDATLPPGLAAFAVECFRDDLHWLGTQVAVLDGHRGVDFLGRILLEQEALHREIEAWKDRVPDKAAHAGLRLDTRGHQASAPLSLATEACAFQASEAQSMADGDNPEAINELERAAQRLRTAALCLQLEALLAQSQPTEWRGWYQAWQTASRLRARLDPGLPDRSPDSDDKEQCDIVPDALRCRLSEFRQQAQVQWLQRIQSLPPLPRRSALEEITGELADLSSETVTFLEELPLPAGVQTLEILAENLAANRMAVQRAGQLPAEASAFSGRRWKRMSRSLRRRESMVAGELQERRLAWRMERLFGRRAVAALERLILGLLVIFVILLAVEEPLLKYESQHWGTGPIHSGGSRIEPIFAWFDLAICLVFLTEFGLKMGLARGRWLYLKRNWITGVVPAIPVGFLLYVAHQMAAGVPLLLAEEGEWFVVLRFLRYLRLPRMARWLRIARPVLRAARLVVFTLRASDRLVRQLSPLLNRNLLLFERVAISVEEPAYRTALAALRERFHYRASELLRSLPRAAQCRLVKTRIEDITAMLSAPQLGQVALADSSDGFTTREIALESVVAWLVTATPAGISDRIGRGLADSVARWCRAFDLFAVRRLPVIRDLVAAGQQPSPYDTTAWIANRIGLLFRQMLDRVYWLADLYGTVTAPQLVDSLGEWMIKGTARPARRFLMFGAAFLLVSYLASLLPLSPLHTLSQVLKKLVAGPLVILGTLCFLPMLLGMWFRQIANEATDFYSLVAEAQFIGATRILKQRLARRNRALLNQRVLTPELAVLSCAAQDGRPAGSEDIAVSAAAVELLWKDYLERPPFHPTDVGTTNQLLGNLLLISLREGRLAYSRRDRVRLRRLDLAHSRASFRGPYLWFHFVSRSLAQHTAKLIVDYNAFAIPLNRAATADDQEIVRYARWLSRRLRISPEEIPLPEPFRVRHRAILETRQSERIDAGRARCFQTNDFTSVHFLSAAPEHEEDVRRRYGDLVADLMRRDRRDNIRRVFRTYPFHRLPKEQRTFNPLALYQRHMAGGRVLWLPLKIVWWTALVVYLIVRQIGQFVREVLHPSISDLSGLDEADPFAVAVRKIHRMRRPLFVECLRMRAQLDPEYLGVHLPGCPAQLRGITSAAVEEDLDMIEAEPAMKDEFRRLAARRRRQMLEFRSWFTRLQLGQPYAESLRAMVIAYLIDHQRARTCLTATRLLQRAFDDVLAAKPRRWSLADLPQWSFRAAWYRLWWRRRLMTLFQQPAFLHYTEEQRKRCRRLVYCHGGDLVRALRELTVRTGLGDPVEHARRTLTTVGQDPIPWSRQLVVLRAVQTLSVIDLKTYCDLVRELGEYDETDLRPSAETPETAVSLT